jgi:hypothetical protein
MKQVKVSCIDINNNGLKPSYRRINMAYKNNSVIETLEGRRMFDGSLAGGTQYNYDLDRNGEVNGDDAFVVDSRCTETGNTYSGWANGDIDGNGTVDAVDKGLMDAALEEAFSGKTYEGSNPTLPMLGDSNGNGEIDGDDLVVGGSFGTNKSWADGDYTGDGIVDKNDLLIVESAYKITHGETIDGDTLQELDSLRATLSEIDAEALKY